MTLLCGCVKSGGPRHWLAFKLHPTAGRHIDELTAEDGTPLDLDVIDMTFLDANVQVGHSAFASYPCKRYSLLSILADLAVWTLLSAIRTTRHQLPGP